MKTILKSVFGVLFALMNVITVCAANVVSESPVKCTDDTNVYAVSQIQITDSVSEKADVLIRFAINGGRLSSFAELSIRLSKDVSIYINGWIGSIYLSGTMIVKAGEKTSPVTTLADHVDIHSGLPEIDMINISPEELIGKVQFY